MTPARLLAAALLLASAAWGDVDEPPPTHSMFRKAPAAARARVNPFEGDPAAVEAGAKLFRRHCASCHGAEASGTSHGPTLRSSVVEGASPGEIEWFLATGNPRRGMPSWSSLPPPRRWQLVSFLKRGHSYFPPRSSGTAEAGPEALGDR